MFIFEWIQDWLFGEAMKFFQTFFTVMGNMGIEIFDYAWVQGCDALLCSLIVVLHYD